jgi:23S rRNA pseudouridine1911/1915/1917 synthase
VVDAPSHGWRLDRYIAAQIRRLSRTQAARAVDRGGVELQPARPVKPSLRLLEGDRVLIHEYFEEQLDYDSIRIIEENEDFIAFDKPAGMLVHPTAREYGNCVTSYAMEAGLGKLNVVHRLDRETSGVLLLARGRNSAARLAQLFSTSAVEKDYLAIVSDPNGRHPVGVEGCIERSLGIDPHGDAWSLKVGEGRWPAKTSFRCLQRFGELAVLRVRIEGGRQHQIRAHMEMLDTPIWGDKLYGQPPGFYKAWLAGALGPDALAVPRHALHAQRLHFCFDHRSFTITAPMPLDFEQWLGLSDSQLHEFRKQL